MAVAGPVSWSCSPRPLPTRPDPTRPHPRLGRSLRPLAELRAPAARAHAWSCPSPAGGAGQARVAAYRMPPAWITPAPSPRASTRWGLAAAGFIQRLGGLHPPGGRWAALGHHQGCRVGRHLVRPVHTLPMASTQPAADPPVARCGPEDGGCGCGHARERLRAFSLDNVTAGQQACGRCGPAALSRLTRSADHPSPTPGVTTGAPGTRGWPRRPRTPPRTPLQGGARCARFDGGGRAHRACAPCAVLCAVPGRTDRSGWSRADTTLSARGATLGG